MIEVGANDTELVYYSGLKRKPLLPAIRSFLGRDTNSSRHAEVDEVFNKLLRSKTRLQFATRL